MNLCQVSVLYKELKFASHEIETSVGTLCVQCDIIIILPGFSSKLVSYMARHIEKNCCVKLK